MPTKNLLLMDTDIKSPGEEEVTNLVDVIRDYRLIMPSKKVNLLATTSMTLLYYHRYQRYNKMFRIIWMNS